MQCLNTKPDNSPKPFTIAQLSDLHLTGEVGQADSYRKFLACLELAIRHQPDFLLLTGDLVNHHPSPDPHSSQTGYEWLFAVLKNTRLPFITLAGNHDVTLEINSHLPYEHRQFLPIAKDDRLADKVRLSLGDYQLLCLNSAVSGQEFGWLSDDTLVWLDEILSTHPQPVLIALHHPPVAVGSLWIDELRLKNGDELFAILEKHPHAHTLVCGHVHQACELWYKGVQILTTPAVSRQFLPLSDTFALDTDEITGQAGFRLIRLETAGKVESWVVRLG